MSHLVALDGVPADLAASYRTCRALHRRHGTTYYWATHLLPAASRPHVHALYGFCRYADEIVDDLGLAPVEERAHALASLSLRFAHDLARGRSDHPVMAATVHTARLLGLGQEPFDRFLGAMAMDLTVDRYATWDDLLGYMEGSAAVIGEMVVPVLGPDDPEAATGPARDLGLAFQLTNFLRDVGEDLERGRVYLPQEDLARFGARPERRAVDDAWRAALAFQIERARLLYRSADRGIAMLPPRSAACVRTARVLYGEILDRIERNDYDVFTTRARVPTARKLAVAARNVAAGGRATSPGSGVRQLAPTGTRNP